MAKVKLGSPKKRSLLDQENVCGYCLFFQRYPAPSGHLRGNCTHYKEWIETAYAPSGHLRGNCTHYKEWIETAYLTTCSDMSNSRLDEKGIYRLVESDSNGGDWIHIRRDKKQRTRLFLVK